MTGWDGVAAAYSRSFATLCAGTLEWLLDATEPAGERHLDAGCGDGQLARRAHERGRRVVAVDSDPQMVALTSETLSGLSPRAGSGPSTDVTDVPRPGLLRAGLPRLPFHGRAFDIVTANFVINHLFDPRAGVRELLRVTREGGVVALSVWPPGSAGWGVLVGSVFDDAAVVAPPSTRLPKELDFDRSADGCAAMVEDAGGVVLGATDLAWVWRVRSDDLWAAIAGGVASPGATYAAQTPQVQERIHDLFDARTHAASRGGWLEFESHASVVIARP